jgi:hypothetical protein
MDTVYRSTPQSNTPDFEGWMDTDERVLRAPGSLQDHAYRKSMHVNTEHATDSHKSVPEPYATPSIPDRHAQGRTDGTVNSTPEQHGAPGTRNEPGVMSPDSRYVEEKKAKLARRRIRAYGNAENQHPGPGSLATGASSACRDGVLEGDCDVVGVRRGLADSSCLDGGNSRDVDESVDSSFEASTCAPSPELGHALSGTNANEGEAGMARSKADFQALTLEAGSTNGKDRALHAHEDIFGLPRSLHDWSKTRGDSAVGAANRAHVDMLCSGKNDAFNIQLAAKQGCVRSTETTSAVRTLEEDMGDAGNEEEGGLWDPATEGIVDQIGELVCVSFLYVYCVCMSVLYVFYMPYVGFSCVYVRM